MVQLDRPYYILVVDYTRLSICTDGRSMPILINRGIFGLGFMPVSIRLK
jgi:hypothetical protein